ncbi:DUF2783 domain-containing protein [Cohaesibacter celericrescens]|uniref:DUF2783 domain-containing protein n=1 Tax=Cohaesibacter celericrescens TaxID=2067669 RepID=A0A2N5XN26_9HYPH|nr:DUF2783 domain-containing protein [Cohaesibacter celericrescens]PLW75956.1 hypothetical protein C0081_17805 [Cohaesibacter celericrescens]
MSLILTPNIENPDNFYQALTDAQRDLSEDEANDMNARLVLILANQVGNLEDLKKAIELAGPQALHK